MTVFCVHLVIDQPQTGASGAWSGRAGGMDRPSHKKTHPAEPLSSSQPDEPPCWTRPLAFGCPPYERTRQRPQSNDWYRGPTELVQHFTYRGKSRHIISYTKVVCVEYALKYRRFSQLSKRKDLYVMMAYQRVWIYIYVLYHLICFCCNYHIPCSVKNKAVHTNNWYGLALLLAYPIGEEGGSNDFQLLRSA